MFQTVTFWTTWTVNLNVHALFFSTVASGRLLNGVGGEPDVAQQWRR